MITADWVTGVNEIIIALIPPVLGVLFVATSFKLVPSRMKDAVTTLLATDIGSRSKR